MADQAPTRRRITPVLPRMPEAKPTPAVRPGTGKTVIGLLVVAAIVFLLGINWGLPSRAVDKYLFGVERPWTGENIVVLTGAWNSESNLGADVDRNPIARRDQPNLLSGSNADRAEIIRRYRLYSYQPDEMITMRAIGQMRPDEGRFDPKLYQYGGLWIYPVAVMMKLATLVHAIALPPPGSSSLAFYLNNPEVFGRFYIVARIYAAAWGLVAVWAVFQLVQRVTGERLIAAAGATAFIFMPVVMNLAHEAKPHLPGCALMLLAVLAALKYVETGKHRWWLAAGALCGAALGMVLSSLPIFLMLPVMAALRRSDRIGRKLAVSAGAVALGLAVYFATNPYVIINFFANRQILRSNLGNSTDMYRVSFSGFRNAIHLIALGTSPLLAMLGLIAAVTLILARRRGQVGAGVHGVGWLLFVPAGVVLVQFILLAAGKPPEYARFALLCDTALLFLAAWAVAVVAPNLMYRQLLSALIVVLAAPYGLAYCRAFVRDASSNTTRLQAAAELAPMTGRILLQGEPAPYNCPPIDLFRHDLVLVPENGSLAFAQPGDLVLKAVDTPVGDVPEGPRRLPLREAPGAVDQFTTPISWASKTFCYQEIRGNLPP